MPSRMPRKWTTSFFVVAIAALPWAPTTAVGGPDEPRPNQFWWPEQLDLSPLRQHGAASNPLGADFDPHWHEAVVRESREGARDGEVTDVLARGYRIKDRLLRPAMVKVATA